MGYLMGSTGRSEAASAKVGLGSVQFPQGLRRPADRLAADQPGEIAAAALENSAARRDRDFYEGKITGARFFARNMLPNLEATKLAIAQIDNDVMSSTKPPSRESPAGA